MGKRSIKVGGVGLALLTAVLVGCATVATDFTASLHPRVMEEVKPAPSTRRDGKPTIALVLGGGGLRGFAHAGVIQALEEAGVDPDIVVGTSAGAVVGAAYASGMNATEIQDAAKAVDLSSLVDWTLSGGGIIRGNSLAKWVNVVTRGKPIEAFPRRFAAVATDLNSERAVLLDRGDAGAAVQASAAIPGIVVPVRYDGGILIDGGIASLVPVKFAKAMGADIIIAVDIYCPSPRANGLGAPTVVYRVMHAQSCMIAAYESAQADVLISPKVVVTKMSASDEQRLATKAGYDAARNALPKILARIAR